MRAGTSHGEAVSYLAWLKRAVWIDKQTRQVKITVPLFNGNHGRINVAVFKLFFDTAGGMRKEVSYVSVPLFANTSTMNAVLYMYLVYGAVYVFLQLRYEYRSLRGCCDALGSCFCCIVSCGHVCCKKNAKADDHDLAKLLSHRSPRNANDRALIRPPKAGEISQAEMEANEALMEQRSPLFLNMMV